MRNLQIQPDKVEAEIGGVLETNFRKVIIIDGMAFVNKVNIKTFQLGTCLDFAECFISMITNETRGYNGVRNIFNKYDPKSLKSNTGGARPKEFHLRDIKFEILHFGHFETKDFISSIETKCDLTEYLSKNWSRI